MWIFISIPRLFLFLKHSFVLPYEGSWLIPVFISFPFFQPYYWMFSKIIIKLNIPLWLAETYIFIQAKDFNLPTYYNSSGSSLNHFIFILLTDIWSYCLLANGLVLIRSNGESTIVCLLSIFEKSTLFCFPLCCCFCCRFEGMKSGWNIEIIIGEACGVLF